MSTSLFCVLFVLGATPVANGEAKPAAVLRGCGGLAVAFSKDGSKIFTAGKDSARVWDGRTFAPVTEPMRHGGEIIFAELSADGKRVLTAGANHVASVWDADTGKPLASIDTGDEIQSGAISPDGAKVATGGSRDSATVWDAASGRKLLVLHAPAGKYNGDKTPSPLAFLVFSPDGAKILGLRATFGSYVWDAKTGGQLASRSFDNGPLDIDGTRSARPAAFSRDGKRVISTDLLAFTVWDATTGRGIGGAGGEDARFLGGPQAVAFGCDANTFGAAGVAATVWHLNDGKTELATDVLNTPTVQIPCDMIFSPDGKRYLIAAEFNTAGVYDAQSGDQILCIGRDRREVPRVAYSPDGNHVAATFPSDDYTTIWRVPDR